MTSAYLSDPPHQQVGTSIPLPSWDPSGGFVPGWAIRHKELADGDIRLYAALAHEVAEGLYARHLRRRDDSDSHGCECFWVWQQDLAKDLNVDVATIFDRLNNLAEYRAIVLRATREDANGTSYLVQVIA